MLNFLSSDRETDDKSTSQPMDVFQGLNGDTSPNIYMEIVFQEAL